VVLGHHLLDEHRRMTLITFDNGKPVLKNGKIGAEQGCCCNNCCQVSFTVHSGLCQHNPPFDYTEEELQAFCDAFQSQYDCLQGVMESLGFTVTQGEWPGCAENICPSEDNVPNSLPCRCSFQLTGTAQCCGFPNGGNFNNWEDLFGIDPNWVDLWAYDGDPCGIAGTETFVIWNWQFSCNQYTQPQIQMVNDVVGYWIPTCNPLP
jgi:hypothetical protein